MPSVGLLYNGRIAEMVDFQELIATMTFPFDAKKRNDLVAQLLEAIRKNFPLEKAAREKWVAQMLRFSESGMSLEVFDQIIFRSLPPHLTTHKSLAQESLANFSKGLLAGQMLVMLVYLADCAPKSATLGKARHLVMSKLQKRAIARDGSAKIDAPLSKRSMKSAWALFSPVCHFYAAFEQMSAEFAHDFKSGEVSRRTMNEFFAVAEAFRRRGQEHKSRGSLQPTLDEERMWTVPSNIKLQEYRVGYGPAEISKNDLAELRRYIRE